MLRQDGKPAIDEPAPPRAGTLLSSFGFAFAGLGYCLRTQRNFRIHTAIAVLGAVAGLLLGLSTVEWAIFVLMCVLVMSAELVNSMVEALVDLVSPGYHPLAKVSKDVAAGVVLLTAIGSVIVGLFIFGPRLLAVLHL
ncbi:MAG: diacylglycerol kinase family protein [Chloroflexota bacterium]|nr:diacylglycerol kinase family protein [Chloroflexota bacterium]